MSLRHNKRNNEAPELDVTTFLNLMVVLIPFLLVSAVFSQITIQELNLPETSGGKAPDKPLVTIEVIVRKEGLELGNGERTFAAIPKVDGQHDLKTLSEKLQAFKGQYPEKKDATILLEPDIEYEDMIHVMDAVKVVQIKQEGEEKAEKFDLFPEVSIGDAP